ncbi:MAG: TlpA family protein disulfide reductase [Candidatus Kaiserbacteria bacterium]|nr:TlpA family protein disulfide reductase [Candidatus Kaiserbacteria bacterium]
MGNMYHIERKHIKIVVILSSIVLLFAVGTFLLVSPYSPFTGLQNDLKSIEPSLESSYLDLDGNPVFLSSMKGKSLIVNSWASWMPFSKDELVLLNELKVKYGDSIQILAINRMEDRELVKSYLDIYSIEKNITFLIDPTDNFYRAIGGYAMPETVFYTSDGTLSTHKRGVLTAEELETYTKNILE